MNSNIEILASFIEERLKTNLPGVQSQMKMSPEIRKFSEATEPEKQAGVLVLLFPVNNEIHIAFIKRSNYKGPHSGQISFPGGMFETTDESLIQTALRETEEEIGLKTKNIKLLGNLSQIYVPVSNTNIYPIVGYVNIHPKFGIDQQEVQRIIQIPVSHLQDKRNIHWESREFEKTKYKIPYFKYKRDKIWGATAMILSEFLAITEEFEPDVYFPQY